MNSSLQFGRDGYSNALTFRAPASVEMDDVGEKKRVTGNCDEGSVMESQSHHHTFVGIFRKKPTEV